MFPHSLPLGSSSLWLKSSHFSQQPTLRLTRSSLLPHSAMGEEKRRGGRRWDGQLLGWCETSAAAPSSCLTNVPWATCHTHTHKQTHTSTYTTGCLCIPGMNVFLSFFGKQIQKPWILLHNISIGLQCWKKDTPTVEAKASGTLVWRISFINCLMHTCIKTKGGLPSVVHCRIAPSSSFVT